MSSRHLPGDSRHFLREGDTVVRLDGRAGQVLAAGALTARVRWRDGAEEDVEQLQPDTTWLPVRTGLADTTWLPVRSGLVAQTAGEAELGLDGQRRGRARRGATRTTTRPQRAVKGPRTPSLPVSSAEIRRLRLLGAGLDVPLSVIEGWSAVENEEADRWLSDGAAGEPGSPEFPPCLDELRWEGRRGGGILRASSWALCVSTVPVDRRQP
jgi:hypothetical protein